MNVFAAGGAAVLRVEPRRRHAPRRRRTRQRHLGGTSARRVARLSASAMRVLVTGGAGLHRLAFRQAPRRGGRGGRRARQADVRGQPGQPRRRRSIELVAGRHRGPRGRRATPREGCDAIVNFAAETHVDRSILEPARLRSRRTSSARRCCSNGRATTASRFVQVSTDEVYGDLEAGGRSTRGRPAAAVEPVQRREGRRRPAGARLRAHVRRRRARSRAARTPTGRTSTRRSCCPLFVTNALDGEPLPVYGDGRQLRDWLHVDDHCAGDRARRCATGGRARSTTSAAATSARTSSITQRILELTGADASLVRHVDDRPGPRPPLLARHGEAARARLGAAGARSRSGLARTVAWYRDNRAWWEPIKSGEYRAYYERQYAERLR